MFKDIFISILLFVLTIIALSFAVFKGVMYYVPIITSSFVLGYIGNRWNWVKILIFIGLFLILINLGILNRTINYINNKILFSWLTDIFIGNLKVIIAILVPAYLARLLKQKVYSDKTP